MNICYRQYIVFKYWILKVFYWGVWRRIFKSKPSRSWHEETFDLANNEGIAMGRIYPYKAVFNSKDYNANK